MSLQVTGVEGTLQGPQQGKKQQEDEWVPA